MSDQARDFGRMMYQEGLSASEMPLAARVGSAMWHVAKRTPWRTVTLRGFQDGKEVLEITTVPDAGVPVLRHLRAYCVQHGIEDFPVDEIRFRAEEVYGGLRHGSTADIFVGKPLFLTTARPTCATVRLIEALSLPSVAWTVDDAVKRLDQHIEEWSLSTVVKS